MIPNILIVDDDQQLLLYVSKALEKYRDRFGVLLAGDGVAAQEQLRRHRVALVVTDLKMPRLDGLGLLAHLLEHFPDVPVIVLTAFSTPEMERTARQRGAIAYLEKPFLVDDLARKILESLERQADGGTLHGVSSGMFLQLIRMEQRTCTIRLSSRRDGRQGALFFLDGELVDARAGDLHGEAAAHEIFAWREVNLAIQNSCAADHPRRIGSTLEAVLLDAMRRRDEAAPAAPPRPPAVAGGDPDPVGRVKGALAQALGERSGVRDVFTDPASGHRVAAAQELGERLALGGLLTAWFSTHGETDTVLLPTEPPTALRVDRKAPRERLLQVLGGL